MEINVRSIYNHHTCWKGLCRNLWKGTVCLFTNTQGSDKHILLRQKDQGSLNFQVTTWRRRRQLITICRPFKRPLRQLSLGSYVFQKKGIWSNHFCFLGLVSFGFGCRHPICCTKCIALYTELKDQCNGKLLLLLCGWKATRRLHLPILGRYFHVKSFPDRGFSKLPSASQQIESRPNISSTPRHRTNAQLQSPKDNKFGGAPS